jgi:NADP-dependent 3-hydroxy acid dehydrogenase YdfG
MSKVVVVLGVGPGLGMSVAHRFGAEGFAVGLVSRGADRHDGYRSALAERGIETTAVAADIRDPAQLTAALSAVGERLGEIDVVYFGPGATDLSERPSDVSETGADAVRSAMEATVYPAVATVAEVLPAMLARGDGGLLFAGGLGGQIPMAMLGALGPATAALRQYVLALHGSLAPRGVYAGTLTIGGLIDRGDIHAMLAREGAEMGSAVAAGTLDPDAIAAEAWDLYAKRDRAEATFTAMR